MTKDKFLKWNVLTNVLMAISINSTAVFLAGGDTAAVSFLYGGRPIRFCIWSD